MSKVVRVKHGSGVWTVQLPQLELITAVLLAADVLKQPTVWAKPHATVAVGLTKARQFHYLAVVADAADADVSCEVGPCIPLETRIEIDNDCAARPPVPLVDDFDIRQTQRRDSLVAQFAATLLLQLVRQRQPVQDLGCLRYILQRLEPLPRPATEAPNLRLI